MNEREQLVNTLRLSYETVKMHEQERARYAEKQRTVQNQQALIRECESAKGAKATAKFIGGIVGMLVAVLNSWIVTNAADIGMLAVVLFALFFAGPAFLVYKLLEKLVITPWATKKAAPLRQALAPLQQELAKGQANLQLALSLEREGGIANTLPAQYRSTRAIGFMLQAVQSYRADSIKEAVNLYEEQTHRQRLEQGQQKIITQQQALQTQMEETQRSADAAARAADHATWAAYSNYNR